MPMNQLQLQDELDNIIQDLLADFDTHREIEEDIRNTYKKELDTQLKKIGEELKRDNLVACQKFAVSMLDQTFSEVTG